MRSLRPRPWPAARVAPASRVRAAHQSRAAQQRRALATAVAAATLIAAGCSAPGASDPADAGPPRLTPEPRPEIAAAMLEGRDGSGERLNACELLDLTTEEIIDLTGADMPEVEPTGSGDLGLLCTYGGPGSPERYEMQLAGETTDETDEAAETEDGTTATSETTTTTSPTAVEFDPDWVPDTFAAGVSSPRGGPRAALTGHATLLGVRYACSEVRGDESAGAEGAAAAPGAPAAVRPDLDAAHIDCTAAPAGGGVEVHTVLVADDALWHITMIRPGTPRTPAAEASALAGLHRVAEQILG